jgi:hypothetical protein
MLALYSAGERVTVLPQPLPAAVAASIPPPSWHFGAQPAIIPGGDVNGLHRFGTARSCGWKSIRGLHPISRQGRSYFAVRVDALAAHSSLVVGVGTAAASLDIYPGGPVAQSYGLQCVPDGLSRQLHTGRAFWLDGAGERPLTVGERIRVLLDFSTQGYGGALFFYRFTAADSKQPVLGLNIFAGTRRFPVQGREALSLHCPPPR